MDQENKISSPVINSYMYSQLIFKKDAKNIQWTNVFPSTNDSGKTMPVSLSDHHHNTICICKYPKPSNWTQKLCAVRYYIIYLSIAPSK